MRTPALRSIPIDPEGFPLAGELRWSDEESGLELFQNMHLDSRKNVFSSVQGESFQILAFDEVLMIQQLEVEPEGLILQGPFGYRTRASWQSVAFDEWDRLRGFDEKGLSFVLLRKAQAQLFQLAEDFGDDFLQFSGRRYQIPEWYSQTEKAWDELYQNKSTPWDLGGPASAFVDLLPRLKLPRQRVLVLGCGEGHDALLFAEAGHRVTAVDLSPTALQRARQRDVHSLVEWRCEDAFQTPGVFDLVVEHTFYAALPPSRRPDLVRLWRQKLNGDGFLLGIFFAMPKREGPPFGGSEWELQKRLGTRFQPLVWHRTLLSPADRLGKEFLVYGRFLSSSP